MGGGGYSSNLDIKTKAFYSEETLTNFRLVSLFLEATKNTFTHFMYKAQTRHIVYIKIYWEVYGEGVWGF